MTKQDVIRRVSTQTKLDPAISRAVIESFFEVVRESLTQSKPIYIRQFGKFSIKHRAEKVARDINRNTAVTVAAYIIPAFKPSREFVDRVRAREEALSESWPTAFGDPLAGSRPAKQGGSMVAM